MILLIIILLFFLYNCWLSGSPVYYCMILLKSVGFFFILDIWDCKLKTATRYITYINTVVFSRIYLLHARPKYSVSTYPLICLHSPIWPQEGTVTSLWKELLTLHRCVIKRSWNNFYYKKSSIWIVKVCIFCWYHYFKFDLFYIYSFWYTSRAAFLGDALILSSV